MYYPNLFKTHYILQGRDWLRRVSPEDRKVFVELGFKHSEFGKLGGKKRAEFGKRDAKGRFIK